MKNKAISRDELLKELRLIQGMCGTPDAAQGCRNIIKVAQGIIDRLGREVSETNNKTIPSVTWDNETGDISINGKVVSRWKDEWTQEWPEDITWSRTIGGIISTCVKSIASSNPSGSDDSEMLKKLIVYTHACFATKARIASEIGMSLSDFVARYPDLSTEADAYQSHLQTASESPDTSETFQKLKSEYWNEKQKWVEAQKRNIDLEKRIRELEVENEALMKNENGAIAEITDLEGQLKKVTDALEKLATRVDDYAHAGNIMCFSYDKQRDDDEASLSECLEDVQLLLESLRSKK